MTNESFVVDGNGQAEEVLEGTVSDGLHGENCQCSTSLADVAAMAVSVATSDFVRENADRFNQAGIDVPNILAGENVTGELTETEKLFVEAITRGFTYGKAFAEATSQPPAYAYFNDIDSLDALLDELLAEGEGALPQLVE